MMDSNKHREAATAGRFSAQYADGEIAHLRHMIRCVNRDGAMNADYRRARMERLQLDADLLPQQRDCVKALMRELESMSAQLHESFDVASPPPVAEPLTLRHGGSA
jgi:hypothetical protein